MAAPLMSDRNFTEKLIEEVRRHPVLYNPRESGYKDRHRVESTWRAVASAVGCTADAAKRRWQNLRGSYSRSRSSQSQTLSGGSAAGGKKRPFFYLHKQMSFLEPYMQHGPMLGKLGSYDSEFLLDLESGVSEVQEDTDSPGTSTAPMSPSAAMEQAELMATPDTSAIPARPMKRSPPTPDEDSYYLKDTTARYFEAKFQNHETNQDLESLRGLLPHMAILSERRKRTFLRKVYNLLFDILEEQDVENDSMSAVYT